MILPNDCDDIREQTIVYRSRIEELQMVMRKIYNLTDVPVSTCETEISLLVETCRILITDLKTTHEILNNPVWKNPEELERLISNMQKLFDHSSRIMKYFTPEIFLRNPARLFSEFNEFAEKNKLVKIFSGDYKKLKTEITGYYYGEIPEDEQILKDLEDAKDYVTARDEWERDKETYMSLFAPVWKDEFTDPAKLSEYKDWILAILTLIKEGLVTHRTIDLLCAGNISRTELTALFGELEEAVQKHSEARNILFKALGISEETDFTFAEARKLADIWITDIDRLEEWSKFLTFAETVSKTTAAPVIQLLFEGRISKGELIPAYLVGYADSLLREAYNTRPILARFSQIPHEQKIESFAEYDRIAVSDNAKRIIRTLEKNVPEIISGASRDSEMGVLTGEFNRKRNHMSIRMLMTKSGGLIQRIKPCFMMSPLSVAQYLDPCSVQFDVIIFDEASQVKPEDALGALMRGKQLVVMGDSRQLPPTTFFDQIGGNDDDDDSDIVAGITDMESLLHVCKQSYPTRRLRWHYRSRHESLIAVSNYEFYDGNLLLFPSPQHETPDLGLSFVYLPDTIYDRGKAGVNKDEAKAVAEAVISNYEKFPHKSLGVATFSTRQQDAIIHEVEILLRTHPDIEMLMHPANGENFFVKNLETVQGDERDTILISIGYGFDANHRLSRNFGPLNQAGGERRLNVLITRARERCVVYSNFRGADLNISSDSGAGLTALAGFLTYAENRTGLPNSENSAKSDASELFSETVARMLEDNGYTVTRNLGCAGFRIDIAVASPTESGIYMAGILCDGPYYWSSDVARDRDRLRNQVLKGLGWNLVRVWSAEWFQHPISCTKVLLDFLKEAEASPIKIEEPVPEEQPESEISEDSLSEIKYEDTEPEPTLPYAKVSFEPYVCCSESVLSNYHQFSSVQDNVLQTAILEIVEIEGPISLSVLSKRIKELGNSVRMTAKAKQRIVSLAEDLVNADNLTKDEEGFYAVPVIEIVPRERPNKWEFDDVSLSEISQAAKIILSKQFATPKSDLARQTAIVLGFKATAQIKERVIAAIDKAVASGEIILDGDVCRIDEDEEME
ncbi:MAG: DUF3320 domain-containing protein [Methanocorpusculum sp.]|nr:DUF3320 domain-containing protein [Methanocorpusculum sp.]